MMLLPETWTAIDEMTVDLERDNLPWLSWMLNDFTARKAGMLTDDQIAELLRECYRIMLNKADAAELRRIQRKKRIA